MAEAAEILREIADEYERSAKAREQLAIMADGNALAPNLPSRQAAEQRQTAQRARTDQIFFQARAAAARQGAAALETAHG